MTGSSSVVGEGETRLATSGAMTLSQAAGNLEETPLSQDAFRKELRPSPETDTVCTWTVSLDCWQMAVSAFFAAPSSQRASWSHWAWKVKTPSGNSTVTLFPWLHFLQLRRNDLIVLVLSSPLFADMMSLRFERFSNGLFDWVLRGPDCFLEC